MAKGRTRRGGGNGSAEAPASDADRIIDATLTGIAEIGWRRLSLAAIAARAELPIIAVYRTFPSKQAVLCGLFRRIDEAVLAELPEPEADERPRDRVFDLLMRRFDALRSYKPALEVLQRELPSDPVAALALGGRLLRSIRWMLEAAEIGTTGIGGTLAIKLTAAVYLATQRVWMTDESPDLAPTMATLDRRLRGIERWLAAGRPASPEATAPI
jgi:AcrR family transcriptional regulator